MSAEGSTAAERRLVLSISGMTCAGCANTVKRLLTGVQGVTAVDVDLARGRAEVAGTAASADLIAAVEAGGFDASSSG
ncbi:MAG: heavy-metal-associated domain-containing protein [Gammaproteobacteria bacterium]|nr:heavy-metal-associated domain-containing protein [Gammaproteobacteria bacterium]